MDYTTLPFHSTLRVLHLPLESATAYSATHDDKNFLEKRLTAIAFLFKSDAYKHENEVRMIVKGVEFKKNFMMGMPFQKVYIELAPIKNVVKQITLGPRVDNINKFAAAFYYRYDDNPPVITVSKKPYR